MGINIGIHAKVTCTLRDAETLEIDSETVYDNIQTNFSKNAMAQWITGVATSAIPPPTKIQLGNGVGTPATSDTALFAPVGGTLYVCDTITNVSTYYAQFVRTYVAADPAGLFTEAGLLDAAGNLWGHVTISQFKSSSQLLTIQWQVYFTYDSTVTSSVLTNYGLIALAKWMTGTSNVFGAGGEIIPPTQIILGSGSGTPAITDTALFSPVALTLKMADSALYNSITNSAQYAKTYGAADPSGTFTEMGVQDTNGNLWTHSLLIPNPTRTGSLYLAAVNTLYFQAS